MTTNSTTAEDRLAKLGIQREKTGGNACPGSKTAINPLTKVIRQIRRSTLVRDGAGCTDAQLSASFIEQRDEAAFAALVRLHAPMVWDVCRRVLQSHHDAGRRIRAQRLEAEGRKFKTCHGAHRLG